MKILRLTALAAVTALVLSLPATASAAKFRAVIEASQVTTWNMDRQLNSSGCTWQEGRGRESARFRGSGIVNGNGGVSGARWTYDGLAGIPLRGISTRFNLTMAEDEPTAGGTRCGAVSPRERLFVRCGTRRGAVFGRLDWDDSQISVGLRDPRRNLAFANCPVYTPRGVPAVGLGEATQRIRNVLSPRYQKQTMQVRRTFRDTVTREGRDIETTSVVRWKLTLYRFGAHR